MVIFSKEANQLRCPYVLPQLPYGKEALEPHISAETLEFHYDKHHAGYVTNLNKLLEKQNLGTVSLEEIITESYARNLTSIYSNACQVWNHTFFWHSMTPNFSTEINSEFLVKKIDDTFGDVNGLKNEFTKVGTSQLGSGWVWLVVNRLEELLIISTSNADNPITKNLYPLFVCDLWEHSYYIDFRNRRAEYIQTFLNHLVNWDFAVSNFYMGLRAELPV